MVGAQVHIIPEPGVLDPQGRAVAEARAAVAHSEGDCFANPNGSPAAIAGVLDPTRHILGTMPHPERAVDPAPGGTDGLPLFEGLARTLSG